MSQDLRGELADLTRAFRVWAEFAEDAGTFGLPSGIPLGRRGEARAAGQSTGTAAPTAAVMPQTPPSAARSAPASPTAATPSTAARTGTTSPFATASSPPARGSEAGRSVQLDPTQLSPARIVAVGSPVPEDGLSIEERRVRLASLQERVVTCQACALHRGRHNTVFARGSEGAELAFVGEGPGADEDIQGLPFVGKAGQLLDKMIEAMGYRPDDVYIANVVKCRPPDNRKPEPLEMAACMPYLTEQLELVAPRAIVALGATATEGLLGLTGITRLRGTWRLWRGRIPVMPTFHPSYLLRTPSAKREVWDDLKKVLERLGRTPPPPRSRAGG